MALGLVLAAAFVGSVFHGSAEVMPPADGPATPGAEELVQLKIELPKPTKEARLLNVGDLSTADDYPSEAIDREEEGRANAWLLVGTDGRVERCGIAITSGSSSLDARSCAILTARARFEPASDARGKAIRSLFYMPMTWKLVDTTDTPDKLAAEAQAIKLLRPELSKPASDAKLLNASELASAMDYPEESLVKEEEGTVYALILVGTEGLVERCGIERSSGSLALDAQTCSLIIAKARFEPARDRRGRSIQSLFHQRLTWRLQGRASPTPKDEIHRLTIVVGPANQIRSCKSEFIANERLVENPNFYCENYLRNGGGMLAAARQKSKLEEAVVVIENWFAITQNLQIPAVGRRSGEVLVALRSGSASYSAEGKRVRCTSGESIGLPGFLENVCGSADGELPRQLRKPFGIPIENLRFLSAIYLQGEPN